MGENTTARKLEHCDRPYLAQAARSAAPDRAKPAARGARRHVCEQTCESIRAAPSPATLRHLGRAIQFARETAPTHLPAWRGPARAKQQGRRHSISRRLRAMPAGRGRCWLRRSACRCAVCLAYLAANTGWVNVGVDNDTAALAVQTIRRWWQEVGRVRYPLARRLLITADGGGSNGSRVRLWKLELQRLADELAISIEVHHLPPGTSK